jgi:hypothetical protein
MGYYVIGPNTNFSSESNGLHGVHARGVDGENPNVVCGSEDNTPCWPKCKYKCGIKSYHSNLKSIYNSIKERFDGRHMDWLTYHLTSEILTHYWYGAQCKAFGYVRNRKHEGIVPSALIRTFTIPYTNILICLQDNVVYVGSVNNRPKVSTIHSPDFKWAQCDWSIASHGMIYKHDVNVFKMLHLDIEDGVVVREGSG